MTCLQALAKQFADSVQEDSNNIPTAEPLIQGLSLTDGPWAENGLISCVTCFTVHLFYYLPNTSGYHISYI